MLDQNMVVALLLLDFSKAMDSVDHELLCRKLVRFFGFSSSAVCFLKSYLRQRSQCVFVNGVFSEFLVTSMYDVYANDFQIYAGDIVDNFAHCVERRRILFVEYTGGHLRTGSFSTLGKPRP
jgi:hypothetical protein